MLAELASFFGVTLDELVGYEPQLGREQIRRIYRELAEDFAKKPFAEVMAVCRRYIRRYGSCILPMDETLALVALDLSGRPLLVFDVKSPAPMIKDLDVRLFHEFFQALSVKAGMNLHVRLLAGEEVHHVFEAIFKGFAKALDQAVGFDPRVTGVLSTKGTL